jgi:sugar phosphate isomerase/epimerase
MVKPFKFSFAVSVSMTNFEAIGRGDWKSIANSLASMGYDGVELAVRDTDEVSETSIREVLDSNSLSLPAIGTGQAFLSDNLYLSSEDLLVREAAVSRVLRHMKLAGAFGASVVIGLIRGGVVKASELQRRRKLFTETLSRLCKKAESMSVNILIEPINRYETSMFPTIGSAAGLIKEIGSNRIKILMDTFHMNIEEADMYETIEQYGAMVGHVHLADSNRLAPGMGHIDFHRILESLKNVGYKGFLSFEILPVPSVEQAASDAITYIMNQF